MRDRGESGTSTQKPGNDFDSYFDAEQHCGEDHFGHGGPCGWMPGGGRGRRQAMMMGMMSDPSGVYGMDHGHRFGFGGRGGRRGHRGGWFGFGDRGHGHGGRGRGRNGRGYGRFFVDDDDEYVTSMAEQMDECHLKEGCKRDGSGSSESSSSSSESDDEQNAPDVNVQGRQPHDGEVLETEGKATDQAQQETTKSNATALEKEKASSHYACNHGKHGCRNGRGHHKHHHGKHKHHRHTPFHHSMIPPPIPPHLLGFNRPPFPPMHHSHHRFSDCHGNRHMAKKFLKRSMKQWYKAQKRARKRNQLGCHRRRVQRSDEDEATCGCDKDDDFALPETRCQLPSPWPFFTYSHHGCGHGRRGFCRNRKKGKKHDKRLRKCNGERPQPAVDTTATKTHEDAVNDVEKVHEVHAESKDDQAMMEEAAE